MEMYDGDMRYCQLVQTLRFGCLLVQRCVHKTSIFITRVCFSFVFINIILVGVGGVGGVGGV